MLERITDFMSHPDLIFGCVATSAGVRLSAELSLSTPSAENCEEPEERFIRVLQYYLAGWHIKPKGVKKPYVSSPPAAFSRYKVRVTGDESS